MKKDKQKFSLLTLEAESIKLENILRQSSSINLKRLAFFSFFNKLAAQKDQSLFRSYYVQYFSYLQKLTDGIMESNWDPKMILQFRQIVDNFGEFATSDEDVRLVEKTKLILTAAAALQFVYVGEIDQCSDLLGIDIKRSDFLAANRFDIEKCVRQLLLNERIKNEIWEKIKPYLKKWLQNRIAFSGNSIHILIVDDFSGYEKNVEAQGKIVTLSGVVRERPVDAEENRIVLNNRVQSAMGDLYYSLSDGITAVKTTAELPDPVKNSFHNFQFSVTEKEAELSGNSIGLGASLLAYTLLLNRYYRAQIAGIGASTAITGCIQQNGAITPVDTGGLKAKLKAAFFSSISRVIIPEDNLIEAISYIKFLKKSYPHRFLAVESFDSLAHAIQDRNLVNRQKVTLLKRSLGVAMRVPQHYYFSIIFAILFVALLLVSGNFLLSKKPTPSSFSIEGGELRIFDENHKFLWAHDFGVELKEKNYDKNVILKDIDRDGKIDVLFGSYNNKEASFSGNVWRFDHEGNIVWKRHVGRAVSFGGEIYADHFRIYQICVADLNHDGDNEIIQVAFQWPWFPVCIQITDVNGKLIREYWHIGQIEFIAFADLNKDGIDEILIGGQNNEYGNAILAVLDYRFIQGCSPQTEHSRIFADSLKPGTEMYYLRFPKTEFKKYASSGRDKVLSIQKKGKEFSVAITNMYPNSNWSYPFPVGLVYYELNEHLELKSDPGFGDAYVSFLINRFGKKPEDIKPEDYRRILYWDGEQWTDKATVNKRWKDLSE